MSINFTATESVEAMVSQIESAFAEQSVQLTDSAKALFALALQSQETDGVLPEGEIFRRLREDIELKDIARNYKRTYRSKNIDFNRAFHVVNEVSFLAKYPWTPSAE